MLPYISISIFVIVSPFWINLLDFYIFFGMTEQELTFEQTTTKFIFGVKPHDTTICTNQACCNKTHFFQYSMLPVIVHVRLISYQINKHIKKMSPIVSDLDNFDAKIKDAKFFHSII